MFRFRLFLNRIVFRDPVAHEERAVSLMEPFKSANIQVKAKTLVQYQDIPVTTLSPEDCHTRIHDT